VLTKSRYFDVLYSLFKKWSITLKSPLFCFLFSWEDDREKEKRTRIDKEIHELRQCGWLELIKCWQKEVVKTVARPGENDIQTARHNKGGDIPEKCKKKYSKQTKTQHLTCWKREIYISDLSLPMKCEVLNIVEILQNYKVCIWGQTNQAQLGYVVERVQRNGDREFGIVFFWVRLSPIPSVGIELTPEEKKTIYMQKYCLGSSGMESSSAVSGCSTEWWWAIIMMLIWSLELKMWLEWQMLHPPCFSESHSVLGFFGKGFYIFPTFQMAELRACRSVVCRNPLA